MSSFSVLPSACRKAGAGEAETIAAVNAAALTGVLDGTRSAYRDIAILNAAAALMMAGRAASLSAGAAMADAAVESGAARDVLARLVRASNAPSPEETVR